MHRQCTKAVLLMLALQWQGKELVHYRRCHMSSVLQNAMSFLRFQKVCSFSKAFVDKKKTKTRLQAHFPLLSLLISLLIVYFPSLNESSVTCSLIFFPCTWRNNQVISTSFTIIEACWHALPLQSYHWEHGFRGQDAFIFHLETSHT